MKTIPFYFDPISPYVYLAWTQLAQFEKENDVTFEYIPILFAGLLNTHGQKGPAEIPPKRIYTFKDVARWAHRYQVPLKMPPLHPFNPLLPLRICVAAENEKDRAKIAGVFIQATWGKGLDISDEKVVRELLLKNGFEAEVLLQEVQKSEVKERLKRNTEDAIQKGVFGVPSFRVDDEIFWGNDRIDFLKDYLKGINPLQHEVIEQVLKTPRGADRKNITLPN